MEKQFFIPNRMIETPNWVMWRKEAVRGRITKVPYYVRSGYSDFDYCFPRASSTDPETWNSYRVIKHFREKHKETFDGIGFVVTRNSGLVFIDIDNCIDDRGAFDDRAKDFIETLHKSAFCEISQSGRGLHFFVSGAIPRSFKNPKNGVEMYAEKRYCAITGDSILQNEPEQDPEALHRLFEEYKTPDRVKTESSHRGPAEHSLGLSDARLIQMASKNPRFSALWSGDWSGYASHSEADLALCGRLAFWCDRDIGKMDLLFRMSGLYRDKWEKREDYRLSTLNLACDECEECFSEYLSRKKYEEMEELEKCFLSN